MKTLAVEDIHLRAQPMFYTEQCLWKRNHLLQTLSSLKLTAYEMFGQTSELMSQTCDLTFVSIECDDISLSSTSQKSVMDASGRSGKSLLQFLGWLTALQHTKRPRVVVFECVAALKYNKQFERGTDRVSEQMTELGYFTSFTLLDSADFGLPQSRRRCYGIALRLQGFGSQGRSEAQQAVQAAWNTVTRLRLTEVEALDHLWKRCQEENPVLDGMKCQKKARPAAAKCKWPAAHDNFIKVKQLLESDLAQPQVAWAYSQFKNLSVPARESEANRLCFAMLRKNLGKDIPLDKVMVVNSGDSIDRMRFSANLHHCLLPCKSYTYICSSGASINRSAAFWFGLQGLSHREMAVAGLPGTLSLSQVQDLAGNGFAANIVASMILSVLASGLLSGGQ